jgi:hypothetical protein
MSAVDTALGNGERGRIEAAVRAELPDVEIGNDISQSNGETLVPIKPHSYPSAMFKFFEKLALAEIHLRDRGLKVRLIPDVPQKELVVAWGPTFQTIAYLSSDGKEFDDLALLLRLQDVPNSTMFDAYPYDNDEELSEVLEDAKREHKTADFSRISQA